MKGLHACEQTHFSSSLSIWCEFAKYSHSLEKNISRPNVIIITKHELYLCVWKPSWFSLGKIIEVDWPKKGINIRKDLKHLLDISFDILYLGYYKLYHRGSFKKYNKRGRKTQGGFQPRNVLGRNYSQLYIYIMVKKLTMRVRNNQELMFMLNWLSYQAITH